MGQPGGQIAVSPGALLTHANRIEAVGGELGTAKAAGDSVRVGVDAYGKLCTFVPALLDTLQDTLIDAIDAGAQSLHDTGERLRTVAQSYTGSDQASAAATGVLQGQL
ncbi:type VII secretion target [Hamadaea tsunoensis]|uniref:type VII secretion target n=1 Tax=Hamadaea tsunoensis TaxID=53368 RepID=UPI0004238F53|nr:type VII secretion target [Hamadaea tsunoensis]